MQERGWQCVRSFRCGSDGKEDLVYLFPLLRRDGSITCHVTGSRRYSEDLVQGGLEVPCVLRFECDIKQTAKAKKLVESALTITTVDLLASKKRIAFPLFSLTLLKTLPRNGYSSDQALYLPLLTRNISWLEKSSTIIIYRLGTGHTKKAIFRNNRTNLLQA